MTNITDTDAAVVVRNDKLFAGTEETLILKVRAGEVCRGDGVPLNVK